MKGNGCKYCNCNNELKEMNKKTVKPLKVRFCPNCRSTDVGFVFRLKNLFGLLPRVECYKCGHFGNEFPLLVISKEDLKKKEKSMKKKDAKKKVKKTKKSVKKISQKKGARRR